MINLLLIPVYIFGGVAWVCMLQLLKLPLDPLDNWSKYPSISTTASRGMTALIWPIHVLLYGGVFTVRLIAVGIGKIIELYCPGGQQ